MQGGKNWIFPKEMNANRLFHTDHRATITSGEEPAALTLFGAMISRAPRSQFLRKLNTPPAPLHQCSKWLPFCLTCGILLYRRLLLFVPVPLAQAVPTSSTPELDGSPFFSEQNCRLQRDCRLSPVLSG
jgi:hypothetical protein